MGAGEMKVEIDFEAEVAKFVKGTEEINRSMDAVGKKLEEHKSSGDSMFSNMMGANLAAKGVEKLAELPQKAAEYFKDLVGGVMESVAATKHLADGLGVATSSLQQLHAAGKLGAGLDSASVDTALEHMSQKLGDVEEKGGKTGQAIKALGLNAEELSGMGADEAMKKIVVALQNVHGGFERAAIAKEIFGKAAGPQMAEMGKNLEENEALARKFGVAMSQADVDKVAEMNHEFEKLGMQWASMDNATVAKMSAALASVAHWASDVISIFSTVDQKTQDLIQREQKANAEAAKAAALAERMRGAKADVESLHDELEKAGRQMGMSDGDKKIDDIRHRFKDLTPEVWEAVHAAEAMQAALTELGDQKKWKDEIAAAFHEIEKEMAMVGLTDGAKKIMELEFRFGDVNEKLEQVKREIAELGHAHPDAPGMEQLEAIKEKGELIQSLLKDAEEAAKGDPTHHADARVKDLRGQLAEAKKEFESAKAAVTSGSADDQRLHELQKEADFLEKTKQRQEQLNAVTAQHKLGDAFLKLYEGASTMAEIQHAIGDLEKRGVKDPSIEQAEKLIKLRKQFKDMGATDEMLGEVTDANAREEQMAKLKKDLEDIRHLTDEARSPAEKWTEEMKKLHDLMGKNLIDKKGFDAAKLQADKAYFEAEEKLRKGADKTEAVVRRFNFDLPQNRPMQLPDEPHQEKKRGKGFEMDKVKLEGPVQMDPADKRVQTDIRDAVQGIFGALANIQTIGSF